MRILAVLLLLLSAACAERWERPGSTEADGDAANAACTDEAILSVPPILVWQIVAPARVERDRQCWVEHGRERCRFFERYHPPQWGQVDINTQTREAWRTSCMRDRGFIFRGYRPLRLN